MFKQGKSGNPKGRPRGAQSHQKIRQAILDAAPEIVETLIAAAKAGDVRAARVLIERALPALKAESAPVFLDAPEELSGRIKAIVDAMLSGALSPTQAGELVSTLALSTRVVPESADVARAIWMVPPELTIEQWTQQAQALAHS
jgi:hypothetical protein